MSKQLAIHNSVIIKEYNNNLVCQQQPRVPHPPGPPVPVPAPPPGPPMTWSRARAASLAPAAEVTRAPAPAPARSLSSPAVSGLHTLPTADTIITQQPPALNNITPQLLSQDNVTPPLPLESQESEKTCSCTKKDLRTEGCPLDGKCLTTNLIYGATVKLLDANGGPIDMS